MPCLRQIRFNRVWHMPKSFAAFDMGRWKHDAMQSIGVLAFKTCRSTCLGPDKSCE